MALKKKKKRDVRTRNKAKRRAKAAASGGTRSGPGEPVPIGGSLYQCVVPEDLFRAGIGNIVVTRHVIGDRLAVGGFHTDVFCRGVREASIDLGYRVGFDAWLAEARQHREMVPTEPACVAKLVQGAVAYARGLGLEPHERYTETLRILGGADPEACPVSYEYGWRGKPLYRPGPFGEPEQFKQIMKKLIDRLGIGGFRVNLSGSNISAVELLQLGLGGSELERLFGAD
jgi:hypothetical protein